MHGCGRDNDDDDDDYEYGHREVHGSILYMYSHIMLLGQFIGSTSESVGAVKNWKQ